jgi:hypothetical protein
VIEVSLLRYRWTLGAGVCGHIFCKSALSEIKRFFKSIRTRQKKKKPKQNKPQKEQKLDADLSTWLSFLSEVSYRETYAYND